MTALHQGRIPLAVEQLRIGAALDTNVLAMRAWAEDQPPSDVAP
jgi:hypothetical protein